QRLVGFDLDQRLAAFERLARLDQPVGDDALVHGLAKTGHRKGDLAHRTIRPATSSMRAASGTLPASSAGETEIGISSPATRTTGSSRKSKHSSEMRAESSAATPPVITLSVTTMARPTRSTCSRTVSKSSGLSVRRSITVASIPFLERF